MVRERASSSRTIGAGAKSRDSEFGPKLSARYLMIVFLSSSLMTPVPIIGSSVRIPLFRVNIFSTRARHVASFPKPR